MVYAFQATEYKLHDEDLVRHKYESCRSNQEDQAKLRAMAISRIWDLL